MMKRKHLTLVLICFLWSLNSKAGLTVRFSDGGTDNRRDDKAVLENTAVDFWFAEETQWKVTPKDQEIEIDFSLVSTDHLAQTRANRVNFNVYLPADETQFALKHEVAHVFFQLQCPKVNDHFTQELFAYWRSGDYIRYLHGNNKIFMKSQAYSSLKEKGPFTASKTLAVTRIINELVKQKNDSFLKDWFSVLMKDCNTDAFLKEQKHLSSQFLDKLYKVQEEKSDKNNWGFLVFDAQANEVIEASGKWALKQPVGSTLKPFLFSYFQDIKNNKTKKNKTEWECGDKKDLSWDSAKALNYSCNGFFLDTSYKRKEMDAYTNALNSILKTEYSSRWLDMADLIGLWPTIQINLLDVAKLYDAVLDQNPSVIEILKKTAKDGTLAKTNESNWFIENKIALKSGTTTRLDLSIDNGFLVAVIKSGSAPKIAVLYRVGQRPIDLLAEFKTKIMKYVEGIEKPAEVQVLSRFLPQSISISCPTILFKNGKQEGGSEIDLNSIKLSTSVKFTCAGQPFEVKSPDLVDRKLYGEIQFRKVDTVSNLESARSEKNARARRGSQIVLKTSEIHYLRNVYFSEGGDFKNELKKALLLVIKSNLEFSKLKNQPICDTTLCQVFNLGYESVSTSQKNEMSKLILEMSNSNLTSKSWLEFSLGGDQAWAQSVSQIELSDFLGIKNGKLQSGNRVDDKFVFNGKESVTCESLRSHFRLRSCPDALEMELDDKVIFKGKGEGHGRGMNLLEANQLAQQGYSFNEIIQRFYGIEVTSYFK